MLTYFQKHLGAKLFLAFSSILCACMLIVVFLSLLLFKGFGEFATQENEQRIKQQALELLNDITLERAQSYEAVFQRIAGYSHHLAKMVEFALRQEGARQQNNTPAPHLTIHAENGIYYSDLTDPVASIYWGGPTITSKASRQIAVVPKIAPILIRAKKKNPEVVASHLIMTEGWAGYHPNFESLFLLPPTSVLDLRNTNNYILANPENNPGRDTVWVPVYYDDVGNGLMTTATSPIYDDNGSFLGVAGLDLPLKNIQRHILDNAVNEPGLRNRSFLNFLLDSHGNFLSFPMQQLERFGIQLDINVFEDSSDLLGTGLLDSTFQDVRIAGQKIMAQANLTQRLPLAKKPFIVASRVLPSTGWRLVTAVPEEAFLAPVHDLKARLVNRMNTLRYQFYLVAALFLLGAILLTVLFLQKIILQPLKQMEAASKRIKDGDLSPRMPVDRHDEIGSLSHAFNRMVRALRRGREREEGYAQELEDTVAEQTLELNNKTKELEATLVKLQGDIKRRQQVEHDLIAAKHAADAANQAKSQFLANMTHELRTPLVGVLGMNDLLSQTRLDTKQKTLVETAQKSGEDLLAVINDVLDVSKIESGNLVLNPDECAPFAIVEDVAQFLADKADAKQLALTCDIDPDAMWVALADEQRLRQILMNLICNAIKFTHEGGIMLRLKMLRRDTTGHFTIEIEDTGIGIPEQDLAKVFNAFVQADTSRTREFGGTGLGLAIVKELVSMMDGTILADSSPGQGSRFCVSLTLPLVRQTPLDLPAAAGGKRVLLQSNKILERQSLQTMLERLNFDVVPVITGMDAWEALTCDATTTIFDLILISDKAKGPDDVSLYEAIGEHPRLPQQTVLIYGSRQAMIQQHFAAEHSLLVKPVSWKDLVEKTAQCLGKVQRKTAKPTSVATGPVAVIPDPLNSSTTPSKQWSILLAEDYAITRQLVDQYLDHDDLVVEHACTGYEVLAAQQETSYDMILMDCNMPDLDGLETTLRLRKQGFDRPIIALTAHVDGEIHEECQAAGMDDVLCKPFRRKELEQIVRKWLGKQGRTN